MCEKWSFFYWRGKKKLKQELQSLENIDDNFIKNNSDAWSSTTKILLRGLKSSMQLINCPDKIGVPSLR